MRHRHHHEEEGGICCRSIIARHSFDKILTALTISEIDHSTFQADPGQTQHQSGTLSLQARVPNFEIHESTNHHQSILCHKLFALPPVLIDETRPGQKFPKQVATVVDDDIFCKPRCVSLVSLLCLVKHALVTLLLFSLGATAFESNLRNGVREQT